MSGKRSWIWLGLLIIYISSFFFQKINLVTADLGRHVQNGYQVVEQGLSNPVLNTNYYSFTQPEFPTINHHWLYGVIASQVHNLAGFNGLTIINVLVMTLAVVFILVASVRHTNLHSSIIAGLVALPLYTNRVEIRPEAISLLFLSLFIWLLIKFVTNKLKANWLYFWLVFLQIIWVNTHLFFILGTGIITVFVVWQVILSRLGNSTNKIKATIKFKTLGLVAILTLLASFINPAGWRGVIIPLNIFNNYGYQVVENQSIPFLIDRVNLMLPWYLIVLTGLLFLGFIIWGGIKIGLSRFQKTANKLDNKHKSKLYHPLLPLVFISPLILIANLFIYRLHPVTGLIMIPALSWVISQIPITKIKTTVTKHALGIMISPILLMCILTICFSSGLFTPNIAQGGLGLIQNQENSLKFFNQHLSGPVFNNYDIGGFLIYGLYPKTTVFVDNRPEAYSVEFLNRYSLAQEKQEVWQVLDEEQNFNTIFFHRHDMTTWAQPFLLDRIKDPGWVPVFVDNYVLILVKDNTLNNAVIEEFALPESIFTSS